MISFLNIILSTAIALTLSVANAEERVTSIADKDVLQSQLFEMMNKPKKDKTEHDIKRVTTKKEVVEKNSGESEAIKKQTIKETTRQDTVKKTETKNDQKKIENINSTVSKAALPNLNIPINVEDVNDISDINDMMLEVKNANSKKIDDSKSKSFEREFDDLMAASEVKKQPAINTTKLDTPMSMDIPKLTLDIPKKPVAVVTNNGENDLDSMTKIDKKDNVMQKSDVEGATENAMKLFTDRQVVKEIEKKTVKDDEILNRAMQLKPEKKDVLPSIQLENSLKTAKLDKKSGGAGSVSSKDTVNKGVLTKEPLTKDVLMKRSETKKTDALSDQNGNDNNEKDAFCNDPFCQKIEKTIKETRKSGIITVEDKKSIDKTDNFDEKITENKKNDKIKISEEKKITQASKDENSVWKNSKIDDIYENKIFEYNEKPSDLDEYKIVGEVPGFRRRAGNTLGNTHLNKIYYHSDYINTLFRAVEEENIGAMDRLFRILRNTEVKNGEGDTPLIYAVRHRKLKSIQYLSKRGCDKNYQNDKGESPQSIAIENRDYKIILLLRNI